MIPGSNQVPQKPIRLVEARESSPREAAAASGDERVQVRRFDDVELHGVPPHEDARVAEMAADKSRSVIFVGGTGSQGIALLSEASKALVAGSHGTKLVLPVRGDEARLEQVRNAVVEGPDGTRVSVREMPGVSVQPMSTVTQRDDRSISIITVPSQALGSVLAQLPRGTHPVATYNGVPPVLPEGIREPEHMVSVFGSGQKPGGAFFFVANPTLKIGAGSPVADDLSKLFGTGINVVRVPDVMVAQWTKIGVNTIANSMATLLGVQVADLRQMIDANPQAETVVKGLCAEIWMVAKQQGVDCSFDDFHKAVMAMMPPTFKHFTSLGLAFRAGKSLNDDIATLSDGVSQWASRAAGGAPGQTPLCDNLTNMLRDLQRQRGDGREVGQDFYDAASTQERLAQLVAPEMLAHAEAAIARAAVPHKRSAEDEASRHDDKRSKSSAAEEKISAKL